MPPRKQSLQALRNELKQIESSAQAKQAAIDAERKAFEDKTAEQRKALVSHLEQAKDLECKIKDARDEVLLELLNPGVIEALAPTHTWRGCGDEARDRDEKGLCARCCLLNAMDRGYVDFTWEFRVSCP